MNEKSLPEHLSVSHLPPWQLRQHLIDVTIALADELLDAGDVDRLEALTVLYETTANALRQRDPRGCR